LSTIKEVLVPDLGNTSAAEIIDISVKPGDVVKADDSLITLESEKASMDIPSPFAGIVKELKIKVGDKVTTGNLILTLETSAEENKSSSEKPKAETAQVETEKQAMPASQKSIPETKMISEESEEDDEGDIHAGPGVRRIAREFGIDLSRIKASGPKGRVLKEDLQTFVKSALSGAATNGSGLPAAPIVDFAQFGETEKKSLSRIKKLTAVNLHRNWVLIPHVTQFDEADITELESFRKAQQANAEKQKIKLTPLVFIMKAVVAALKAFPSFNASLAPNNEELILKKYFHIGVAVDTPEGLVVPVIRDVDKKGLFELAQELGEISVKAREKKLAPADMQGGCFTISSLGGIGGTAFTPIVNLPEVAILGVSKSQMKPVYKDGHFIPRLMLPLSLSYDHRVIDGAEGARFIVHLAECLSDIRKWLL
jgi:pyruvate dehydrogenase E2 component (dihydrolipoamide acetyltransferase)